VDRNEKLRQKEYISRHVNVSNTRLKDWEVSFLVDFIERYNADYRGHTETLRTVETKGFDRGDTYRRRSTISYTLPTTSAFTRSMRSTMMMAKTTHFRATSRTHGASLNGSGSGAQLKYSGTPCSSEGPGAAASATEQFPLILPSANHLWSHL
jgi:hypothetical protein